MGDSLKERIVTLLTDLGSDFSGETSSRPTAELVMEGVTGYRDHFLALQGLYARLADYYRRHGKQWAADAATIGADRSLGLAKDCEFVDRRHYQKATGTVKPHIVTPDGLQQARQTLQGLLYSSRDLPKDI
jgi:hypothetical protein